MPTRAFRFQADVDSTGQFTSATLYDELTAIDPVTDELIGTGNLQPPVVLTADTHPDLFDLLNVIGRAAPDRVANRRSKAAAEAVTAILENLVPKSVP
jgi:hypothetical protein